MPVKVKPHTLTVAMTEPCIYGHMGVRYTKGGHCAECQKINTKQRRLANPVERMLGAARTRALMKGLPFTITAADIQVPRYCPILGTPLARRKDGLSGPRDESPSLDRIDPSLGYVPGNVAVISSRANTVKNSGTAAEHRAIAEWMDLNMGRRY